SLYAHLKAEHARVGASGVQPPPPHTPPPPWVLFLPPTHTTPPTARELSTGQTDCRIPRRRRDQPSGHFKPD
ncbi:hypothetical protein ACFWIZ_12350, partial [Streptomyces sp. NPDC127044]